MTREEILAMQAGREMDVLVAEKILGWQWVHGVGVKVLYSPSRQKGTIVWDCGPRWDLDALPRYSKDIAAAWQVVNTLLGRGCNVEMTGSNEEWCVAFETARTGVAAHGATAAEAICRAALLLEEVDAT